MELASDNLTAHGVGHLVTTVVADLLGGPAPLPVPDVVVANLPYLRTDEVATGTGSLAWEPEPALDGGADGLDLIRSLLAVLPARLAAEGSALLEVGAGQADAVRKLAGEWSGGWSVQTLRDLAGIERVVRLERDGRLP
jgi:release factor glutamine methyltransferase